EPTKQHSFPLGDGSVFQSGSSRHSIAVLYFENASNDEHTKWLSRGLPHMLITDLEQSKRVDVVGYQRLFDILKLIGKEEVEHIDRETATEVARRASATIMLLGGIFKSGNKIRIDYELQNVYDGKLIDANKVIGEEPLVMADELADQIKLRLDIKPETDYSHKVADVTTHSPEAYRCYLEGLDYQFKLYDNEARKSFKKALEHDPEFAMAYYRLTTLIFGERISEKKKWIRRAVELSEKASQKEKMYIKSWEHYLFKDYKKAVQELKRLVHRYPAEKEAYFWQGYILSNRLFELERGISLFQKAIEIDPLYKLAYNMLSYAYDAIGDFERSIAAANKYISLAPDEANPYDTRGEIYGFNNYLDRAIESFEKAIEINPDFNQSIEHLAFMFLFKGEYKKAKVCLQRLSNMNDPNIRSRGRTYLAYIPFYQGKFEQALEVLRNGIASDKLEQYENVWHAEKYFLKADVYREKKDLKKALEQIEEAIEIRDRNSPGNLAYSRDNYVQILIENNRVEKAEKITESLRKKIEDTDQTWMHRFWTAAGLIEVAKGRGEKAISNFLTACRNTSKDYFYPRFQLAVAYLDNNRLGEAVEVFEKLLTVANVDRARFGSLAVKVHYLLGIAYEKSGWNPKALAKYEEFLDIWIEADRGIPELVEASRRMEKLKH
ncbi:MAG: tetratricopeptide repeat protein, partial [Candidatus Thorarchaeota archaeon]